MWKPARDLRPKSCLHTTLHSLCTELSRPHCCQPSLLRGQGAAVGLGKVAASPRQGCGPWSYSPASICLCPSASGAQKQSGAGAASRTGSPTHPARPEGSSLVSSAWRMGLGTVCEAPWAPPFGLCPDTAISTRAQRVWGHKMDTRVRIVLLSFRVLFFLLPMSGDHQGISGLNEPTQA